MAIRTVQRKKDVKTNKKTDKLLANSTEEKEDAIPEEYEEDRSPNIRMKKQPLSQQPKDSPIKGKDKALKRKK